MQSNQYSEENKILDKFLASSRRYPTAEMAWDRLVDLLREIADEDPEEVAVLADPVDEDELIRSLFRAPARQSLLVLLRKVPSLDLNQVLSETGSGARKILPLLVQMVIRDQEQGDDQE